MRSDSDILQTIMQIFAGCDRPEHFSNFTHCEECAEHDELLRSRDIHTLRIEDVGNPGWDPICFISPEGFAYYFPALARLALAEPIYGYDWYGYQLTFHLLHGGRGNRYLLASKPEQRVAIALLLQHLVETRAERADDDLFRALAIWSDEDTGSP